MLVSRCGLTIVLYRDTNIPGFLNLIVLFMIPRIWFALLYASIERYWVRVFVVGVRDWGED